MSRARELADKLHGVELDPRSRDEGAAVLGDAIAFLDALASSESPAPGEAEVEDLRALAERTLPSAEHLVRGGWTVDRLRALLAILAERARDKAELATLKEQYTERHFQYVERGDRIDAARKALEMYASESKRHVLFRTMSMKDCVARAREALTKP